MRVLQVTSCFGEQYGGTERYSYNLSKELVRLGHNVEVFASRLKSTTPITEEFNGLKVRRFPSLGFVWNVNPISILLHSLINAKFDIVHVHSYLYFSSNQAVLAKIIRACFRRKTPLVLHLHGGLGIPPYMRQQPIKRILKKVYDSTIGKLMMLGADQILSACVSDSIKAQEVFNLPRERIAIVYNGIDTSMFLQETPEIEIDSSRYVLFVGDLEYWKGVDKLVDCMRILHEQGEDITLKLVGVGSIEPILRKRSRNLNIEFLGQIPHSEMPKLMSSAFAFILPSLWEGTPTVGLEAMASRTPFIGTNIGGIPEIVKNNITGILVPPNNPDAIANAILDLKNRSLRQTIIQNAYKLVLDRHSIERLAKQTVRVYERVLER
jgi:glycosyltransferase involved in cell wall biosynthesis